MQNIDQTNFEEDSRRIKTPAGMFTKSGSKSPISRLRMTHSPSVPLCTPVPTSNTKTHQCENHRNKQALFCTSTDGQQLYFCEKCAITLASQGHSIQRVKPHMMGSMAASPAQQSMHQSNIQTSKQSHQSHNSHQSQMHGHPTQQSIQNHNGNSRLRIPADPRIRRQQEISSFLRQLRELRGTVSQTRQNVKEKLIESQEFYGVQLEEVNDYFSLIMKSLELEKHKCYNHILNERQQAESHMRTISSDLNSIDHDVAKILSDIEDNLETVYSIEDEMYQLVLSQYLDQQRHFQNNLKGLLLAPIEMRKIEFEGVPESIYNLSDIVIKNSFNTDSQQYRLVDSLNADDLSNIGAHTPPHDYPLQDLQLGNADSLKFSFEAERLRGENMLGSYQCGPIRIS